MPRTKSPASSRFFEIRNAAGDVPTLRLFGDIGRSSEGNSWSFWEPGAGTFREFESALRQLGNVPELRLEIHSYGGDAVVGKAIHDLLVQHPANKTAVIYGICASAATYPAADALIAPRRNGRGLWGYALACCDRLCKSVPSSTLAIRCL